jgi:hypothetical protein
MNSNLNDNKSYNKSYLDTDTLLKKINKKDVYNTIKYIPLKTNYSSLKNIHVTPLIKDNINELIKEKKKIYNKFIIN